tara:strand:- start:217 stop:393 length:177 start_codon:yes stop_codon:yes gene_type:complete
MSAKLTPITDVFAYEGKIEDAVWQTGFRGGNDYLFDETLWVDAMLIEGRLLDEVNGSP